MQKALGSIGGWGDEQEEEEDKGGKKEKGDKENFVTLKQNVCLSVIIKTRAFHMLGKCSTIAYIPNSTFSAKNSKTLSKKIK